MKKYWLVIENHLFVTDDGTIVYEPTYDPKECSKMFDNIYKHEGAGTVDTNIGYYVSAQETDVTTVEP